MELWGGGSIAPSLKLKPTLSKLERFAPIWLWPLASKQHANDGTVIVLTDTLLGPVLKLVQPYLHESRHLHALKRPRGAGGRFLNMSKLQEPKPSSPSTDALIAGSAQPPFNGNNTSESEVHQPENNREGASTTSCSDVTSGSNSDDVFLQPEFRFSTYPPHIGGSMKRNDSGSNNLGGSGLGWQTGQTVDVSAACVHRPSNDPAAGVPWKVILGCVFFISS